MLSLWVNPMLTKISTQQLFVEQIYYKAFYLMPAYNPSRRWLFLSLSGMVSKVGRTSSFKTILSFCTSTGCFSLTDLHLCLSFPCRLYLHLSRPDDCLKSSPGIGCLAGTCVCDPFAVRLDWCHHGFIELECTWGFFCFLHLLTVDAQRNNSTIMTYLWANVICKPCAPNRVQRKLSLVLPSRSSYLAGKGSQKHREVI